ncbi:MAG: ABC transporter permease [Myxococcota bacterium]
MDLLFETWESLTRRPLRTATTAFGVFWGMLLLVVMLGAAEGFRNGVDRLFQDDSATSVWISAGATSRSFEGMPAGRTIELTIDDVDAIAANLEELRDVSPRYPVQATVTAPRTGRTAGLPVYAIGPGYGAVERTQVWRGRLLNELDEERARNVVIVGRRAAEILFDRAESALGEWLDVSGNRFRIVGVFTDAGGDGEMRRVFLPYASLPHTFDASRRTKLIVAMSDPEARPALIRDRVRRLLARRHRFAADDPTALEVDIAMEQWEKFSALMTGIELMVLVIGLGTLLTATSGVSNILLVSVRERTREIGLRRALGASATEIFAMVIAEAVLIASVAGALGVGAGLALLKAIRDLGVRSDFFERPAVDALAIWALLGVLVAIGALAGVFPARQAVRWTPAEALRDE